MHQTGGLHMAQAGQQSVLAEIGDMVVGGGHHVDAHPFKVIQERRRDRHRRAFGGILGAIFGRPHGAFQIGERRIGAFQNILDGEVRRLRKRRQTPGKHGIAGQRDRDIAGF